MKDKYTGDVKGKTMYLCHICKKAFVAFQYDIESFNKELARHVQTNCNRQLPDTYPKEINK